MSATIWGIVEGGKVIPQTPLPDGLQVQITSPEGAALPQEPRGGEEAGSSGSAAALPMIASLRRDADGVIRVGGTRVTLDTVIDAYRDGATAEEITGRYSSLDLGDVYAAIGYFLHRSKDVEMYLAEREAQSARVRRENESRFDPTGVRERMMARRAPEGKR